MSTIETYEIDAIKNKRVKLYNKLKDTTESVILKKSSKYIAVIQEECVRSASDGEYTAHVKFENDSVSDSLVSNIIKHFKDEGLNIDYERSNPHLGIKFYVRWD